MGFRRLLGAGIVVICIGVPLVESFDTWDHTLSDGNDTEANVVVAALCVGLALSTAARIVITRVRSLPSDAPAYLSLPPFVRFTAPDSCPLPSTGSPPLTALRI